MSVDSSYAMYVTVHLCSRVFPRRRTAFNIPIQQMRYFSLVYTILYAGVWSMFLFIFGGVSVGVCVRATAIRGTDNRVLPFPMKFNHRRKYLSQPNEILCFSSFLFLDIFHFRNAVQKIWIFSILFFFYFSLKQKRSTFICISFSVKWFACFCKSQEMNKIRSKAKAKAK